MFMYMYNVYVLRSKLYTGTTHDMDYIYRVTKCVLPGIWERGFVLVRSWRVHVHEAAQRNSIQTFMSGHQYKSLYTYN